MNALELFRSGMDTVEIAGELRVSEAVASRLVYERRCQEMSLPVESVPCRRPNVNSTLDRHGAWRA